MTGYTVHTGTSKKFVDGWDRIFSDNAQQSPTEAKKKKKKSPGKSKKPGKGKKKKS